MVVVLNETRITEVAAGDGTHDALWIPAADVERVCGWSWEGDSLRRGEVSVPVPAGQQEAFARGNSVNLAACWRQIGRPALASADGDVWVLGTAAEERAAALQSLQAPDFTLPDSEGGLHALSDFLGKKVYLASWASW